MVNARVLRDYFQEFFVAKENDISEETFVWMIVDLELWALLQSKNKCANSKYNIKYNGKIFLALFYFSY